MTLAEDIKQAEGELAEARRRARTPFDWVLIRDGERELSMARLRLARELSAGIVAELRSRTHG